MAEKGFRIPRIKTIPYEWLILFVRRQIRKRILKDEQILHVLRNMNATEETEWLLANFPHFDDTPIGKFYKALEQNTLQHLLVESATSGYLPAMGIVSSFLNEAAKRGDPSALFTVGDRTSNEDYILEAANRGVTEAMGVLAVFGEENWKWYARRAFLSAKDIRVDLDFYNLDMIFTIGREMEGYEEIWGSVLRPSKDILKCIDFYLTTVHRARVAALYAVRKLGFGRDIGRMIGKMIYATRGDVYLWNE